MGGITQSSYVLTLSFIILSLGSLALPLTNGFIGEFILLKSIFDYSFVLGIVAGITIILGAVYTLRLIQKTMFGNVSRITTEFSKLTLEEKMILVPLCIFVLLGGIFPNAILHFSEGSVAEITQLLK